MKIRRNEGEVGFTIIEVVLVLAIAGLIFMMVFIALPALQRSQRDAQRKNDLSRLNTALSSYQSNNRGNMPSFTGTATWDDMVTRYVTVNDDTFVDPTGKGYVLIEDDAPDTALSSAFNSENPYIYVASGHTCKGELLTGGQGTRKVAFRMKLEGSGTACANN